MIYTANEFFTQGSGVVTLCGSTKFFTECMEANRQLTFKNWIVLASGSWGHSYHKDAEVICTNHEEVKKLHFYKIQMSHAVVVVSDNSWYIGNSTKAEIKFAQFLNIPLFVFNGVNFTGETDIQPTNNLEDTSLIKQFSTLNNGLGF